MSRIFIIGGCNIDIQGAVNSSLRLRDSNPGEISYSFGGVARNVAENLAHFGETVLLISVLGSDVFGENMFQYCKSIGINMDYVLRSETFPSSTYLAILDEERDMYTAVVDTAILSLLTNDYIDKVLQDVSAEDILVIDTNLDEEIIHYIVAHSKCPIYMDPISTKKAEKIKGCLNAFYFMKPNRYEAEVLSGLKLETLQDEKRILDYFVEKGVKEVVISMGEKGVVASNGKEYIRILHDDVTPVNATGAGDSYMAAYLWAKRSGNEFQDCLEIACAVAICTILDNETVGRAINCDKIEQVRKEMNIRGEKIC